MIRNASKLFPIVRGSLLRSSTLPLSGAALAASLHVSSAAAQSSYAPAVGDTLSADKEEVLRLNQALLDSVMRLDWNAVS